MAASGDIEVERIVDKTSHAVADIFGVVDRGYVREGYFADLVLIDPDKPTPVTKNSLLAKCHWSPFEGHTFRSSVDTTIVNGTVVWEKGELTGEIAGTPLEFDRAR
jgi:dihydroorotase